MAQKYKGLSTKKKASCTTCHNLISEHSNPLEKDLQETKGGATTKFG